MAGTAAWKKAWRKGNAQRVFLAKLTLVTADESSSETYYLAGSEVQTPAGTFEVPMLWQGIVEDFHTVQADGAMLASDFQQVTAKIKIGRARLGSQTGTEDLLDTLVGCRYEPQSTLTIYAWERSLTSFDDALQVFSGDIETAQATPMAINVLARQRMDWNGQITPRVVTMGKYPYAPEGSIGAPLPICYGKVGGQESRPPLSAYGEVQHTIERIAGGSRVGAALLVDTGFSDGRAKIVVAGNNTDSLADPDVGTSVFMLGEDDKLHVIEVDAGDVFTTDSESGFYLTPSDIPVWQPVYPVEMIDTGAYDVPTGRAILDPLNDASYATMNYNLGHRNLRARLPSITPPGTAQAAKAFVIYRTNDLDDPLIDFTLWNESTEDNPAPGGTLVSLPNTGGAVAVAEIDFPSDPAGVFPFPPVTKAWDFSSMYLSVDYNDFGFPNADSVVNVFAMGLSVQYTPSTDTMKAARVVESSRTMSVPRRSPWSGARYTVTVPYTHRETVPAVLAVRGRFFANFHGAADDGSGTYTGSPSTLIECPPDIMHAVLRQYGAQAAGQIMLDTGEHGSFVDARDLMITRFGTPMVLGMSISDPLDVQTLLAQIGACSLSWVFLSQYDDKFRFVPWKAGAAVTWDAEIGWDEIIGMPVASRTPGSRVTTGVSIPYGWDESRRSFAHEVVVSTTRSGAGYKYRNLPDQDFHVVAGENDTIFVYGSFVGSPAELTMEAGDYTLSEALSLLRDLFYADAGAATLEWAFSFGGVIVAGVNDRIPLSTGEVFIPEGTYATMTDLAAAAQTTCGGAWTVTYNTSTLKFTFDNPTAYTISWGNVNQNCAAAAFGFDRENSLTLPATSVFAHSELQFALSASDLFVIPWSGTSGTADVSTAASVLGVEPMHDWWEYGVGGVKYGVGLAAKGNRGLLCRTSARRYRAKRESAIEGRAIYDTDTALEIRNRMIDIAGIPRVELEVVSYWLTGIDRGEVFTLQANVDPYLPYPDPDSDGSWVGKKMMVMTTEQLTGPDAMATRVVAISIDDVADAALEATSPFTDLYIGAMWLHTISSLVYPRFMGIEEDGTIVFAEVTGSALSADTSLGTGSGNWPSRVMVNTDRSITGAWIGGDGNMHVQRVDPYGNVLFGADGVSITSESPVFFDLCTDDANGCWLAWIPLTGSDDCMIALVLANGTVEAGFPLELAATGNQCVNVQVCPDESGGVIVVWAEKNSSFYDIFVQRVTEDGAQWTAGGIQLTTSGDSEFLATIVSDGAGGAFLAWVRMTGLDTASYDIYAQHINSAGAAQWTAGGVPVCMTQANVQEAPQVVREGLGGCIVCWRDTRSGNRVYAQRVSSAGTVQWTANGVDVMAGTSTSGEEPRMVSDGANGAIIVTEVLASTDIRAQRISNAGALLWDSSAVIVAPSATSTRRRPRAAADASGGAYVIWQEGKNDSGGDIYLQQVNANGVLQLTAGGVVLASGSTDQVWPDISVALTVPLEYSVLFAFAWRPSDTTKTMMRGLDEDGVMPYPEVEMDDSAIATDRAVTVNLIDGSSIYAYVPNNADPPVVNKVDATGSELWGSGIETGTVGARNAENYLRLVSDTLGGAYVIWQTTAQDMRLVRIGADGTFPTGWAIDGIALETGSGTYLTWAVPDGFGGALIVWDTNSHDIHVQRVGPSGLLWTAGGVAVNSGTTDCFHPFVAADGAGGAYVSFIRFVSAGIYNVLVQHFNDSGVAQWTAGGVIVYTGIAASWACRPTVVRSGTGVIVSWYDERTGSGLIYSQLLNSAGAAQWTTDGVYILPSQDISLASPETLDWEKAPMSVPDGADGAIIITAVTASNDIRGQRINASGAVQWDAAGVVVAPSGSNTRTRFDVITDRDGGAVVGWVENKSDVGGDIYAQRIDSSGDLLWTAGGVMVATGTDDQNEIRASTGSA